MTESSAETKSYIKSGPPLLTFVVAGRDTLVESEYSSGMAA